jgi:hypothetical protein
LVFLGITLKKRNLMKSNSELLENLILQNINYKDVISAFAEGDKFPILKNDLREQIQDKIACITELEDAYLKTKTLEQLETNTEPSVDPIFWINLTQLHEKNSLSTTITYINQALRQAKNDYNVLICQTQNNQNLFTILSMQQDRMELMAQRLNSYLLNQTA